ncbi:Uncharacterized protein PBTT_07662 [Plasmodiophora brassicae]
MKCTSGARLCVVFLLVLCVWVALCEDVGKDKYTLASDPIDIPRPQTRHARDRRRRHIAAVPKPAFYELQDTAFGDESDLQFAFDDGVQMPFSRSQAPLAVARSEYNVTVGIGIRILSSRIQERDRFAARFGPRLSASLLSENRV